MEVNKLTKKISFFIVAGLLMILDAKSQTKYWVKFKDKANSPYSVSNPSTYLSSKSLTRRINQNIAIDETDLPINQTYVNQVNATGAKVFQRSKWFNAAIVIVTNPSQLTAINTLTCVLNTSLVGRFKNTSNYELSNTLPSSKKTNITSAYNYGPSFTQVSQIGADCMHNLGFRGQNVLIAVIDAGFRLVGTNPVFDSLRNEGRLLGTRDLVAGNTSVFEDDSHGALVFSLLAGNSPGNLIGTAPKANYWLLRSEDNFSEKIIEENNWVVAAELADSLGADITTTSLGYTTFDNSADNHVYADLNGRSSPASIAATMASRKGIFVLNAAGNEGAGSWQYIGVPADADSIFTVGAVNGSGIYAAFSSKGPTADGRIKPDVSAMGEASFVCQPSGNFSSGNGTSFACPIMAGGVACLIQANPTKTNMQIMAAIKATASKATAPDNNYGWGIPNLCLANTLLKTTVPVSLTENKIDNPIKLFPNPCENEISFQLTEEIETLTATDMLGNNINFKITNTSNKDSYKLIFNSSITAGVYFIFVKTPKGIFNSKFISTGLKN